VKKNQVINYGLDGKYEPHCDYFESEIQDVTVNPSSRGGPRVMTVIMYLNEVGQGGTTYFPHQNRHISPQKGSALYFSYGNSKGQLDPSTLQLLLMSPRFAPLGTARKHPRRHQE
jgi:prolyl 4-hydroxylase